jgi:hypothetical protein
MKSAIEVMRFALLMRTILTSTYHHKGRHQGRAEIDRQEPMPLVAARPTLP